MDLFWIRGMENINFNRPNIFLPVGLPGCGKSTLLEWLALKHTKIIDLFGSRDNEGLGWCRSPLKDDILFVTGDSVELNGKWDTRKISKLTYADIKKYKVILSVHAFFTNYNEEFWAMNEIIKRLWARTHWVRPWYVAIREAANFIYSRIKIVKNQAVAKADFIYLMRELRHSGFSIGVDTVRWTSMDKEVRDLANYTFVKRVGVHGLPDDIHWLYKFIDPDTLMDLDPSCFVLVSSRGPIALGWLEDIPWHKKEKEDILGILDLEPQYGELPDYLQPGYSAAKVGATEHTQILEAYQEIGNMHLVGVKVKRSSGTVHTHIANHNREVRALGSCSRCKRRNHILQDQIIDLTRKVADT